MSPATCALTSPASPPPYSEPRCGCGSSPTAAARTAPKCGVTGTSWSETGLTWSNRPAPTGGVLDDKGALAGSTWVEYNVTSAVTGNGAVGFVLLPQSNDGAVFDSRQGANKPQLVLNTNSTETPTPTPTATPTRTPTPTPIRPGIRW